MTRPVMAAAAGGLKPTQVRRLLGIGAQTLRYWRTHLDPDPANAHFSSGRLLFYRILKVLIHHHFIPVHRLQPCDLAGLRTACEEVAPTVLAASYLYFNPERAELLLHARSPTIGPRDFDALVVPLEGVVAVHREALEGLGRAPGTPLRLQLPPRLVAVP